MQVHREFSGQACPERRCHPPNLCHGMATCGRSTRVLYLSMTCEPILRISTSDEPKRLHSRYALCTVIPTVGSLPPIPLGLCGHTVHPPISSQTKSHQQKHTANVEKQHLGVFGVNFKFLDTSFCCSSDTRVARDCFPIVTTVNARVLRVSRQ